MTSKHNTPQLKEVVAKAITDFVGKTRTAERGCATAADALQGAGFMWTDLISPKSEGSTASDEVWTFLKSAVVAGFTKEDQNLLSKPTTHGLDKPAKEYRKRLQQRINARLGDLKGSLKNRQTVAEGGANATTRTTLQVMDEQASKWIGRADKITDGMPDEAAKAFRKALADFQKAVRAANKAKA